MKTLKFSMGAYEIDVTLHPEPGKIDVQVFENSDLIDQLVDTIAQHGYLAYAIVERWLRDHNYLLQPAGDQYERWQELELPAELAMSEAERSGIKAEIDLEDGKRLDLFFDTLIADNRAFCREIARRLAETEGDNHSLDAHGEENRTAQG